MGISGALYTDLVGVEMGPGIVGCDGSPAHIIKAVNVTAFCTEANKGGSEAVVAYGRNTQGLIVQLRTETLEGTESVCVPLQELADSARRTYARAFCTQCKKWGVGAQAMAELIVKNAPDSESRG